LISGLELGLGVVVSGGGLCVLHTTQFNGMAKRG